MDENKTENSNITLNLGDYKEAFNLSKDIDNFDILYKNLFFYYWKLQKILIEHSKEIKKEFEEKLFSIVSYEEFQKKYKTNDNQFLLDSYKLYYWGREELNELRIALFLSNFLRFVIWKDKGQNMKIFFSLIRLLNKNNPWEKIEFWEKNSERIYPVISKDVFSTNRWFYIVEQNDISDWFKEWRFLTKSPSRKINIIKEKISGAEATTQNIVFHWQFQTIINNLSKIDFMKINEVEQQMYKPYLAIWFYNQLQYSIDKWWIDPKKFFDKDIMLEYNEEDFFNLFNRYFLSYIIANNQSAKGLKNLALIIK